MAARREFQDIWECLRAGKEAERVLSAEGRTWYRRFRPKERLILLGGGYIAQSLCGLAADLDFAVSVADDRPAFAGAARFPRAERTLCAEYGEAAEALGIGSGDYVAVLTRGHLFDADCLRAVLRGPFPRYVGVIGSRGRAAALLDQLAAEGFSRDLLNRIHTPIGLDIHALTVPEIAVSIAAELVAVRRVGLDRRSKSAILTDDGCALPVLEFLAGDSGTLRKNSGPGDTPDASRSVPGAAKAVLTVCETSGSTPVKPGAMMAVDALGNVSGTIGGGSGEGELIAAALDLLRTRNAEQGAYPDRDTEQEEHPVRDGEQERGKRLVSVNMYSGPTEDGMACGGSMRALIEVVTE